MYWLRSLVLIVTISLFARPVFADVVTVDTAAAATQVTATTITLSATIGNHTNRFLVVSVGYSDNPTCNKVSGVTFNTSETFTSMALGDGQATDIICHEVWYLKAPSITTANIVVTFTGSETGNFGYISFYNVDQTTPFAGGVHSQNVAQTSSTSGALTTVSNDMAVAMQQVRSTTCTATGTETIKYSAASSGSKLVCGEVLLASGSSTTVGFTFVNNPGGYAFGAFVVKQSTTAAGKNGMMMGILP